jgi:uncharacterized membrane protein YkgB
MAEDKEENKDGQEKNSFFPTSESIKMVGGLIAVIVGVGAITALAIVTMALIDSGESANTIIPLSTAAFGVISAIVSAYLGIKIGTDQTKELAKEVTQAHATLAEAVQRLGDEGGQKKVP